MREYNTKLGIAGYGSRGGSRIYKRGGLTQGTNLLGRGVQSTLPSMQSMLELVGSGSMPPPGKF